VDNAAFIRYEEGQIARLSDEARSIVDTHSAAHTEPSDAEQARFASIIADVEARKARIAKLRDEDRRTPELAEMRSRYAEITSTDDPRNHNRPRDEIRDMILGGERQADFDAVAGFERRAVANFSDSGSLYTADFSDYFAMYARTESPWLTLPNIVRADNGRPMVVPGLTADGTAYTPGEGTAITESTPTLDSATVTPLSYKALMYVSFEALEDVEYNLTQRLAESAARTIALKFGAAATTAVLAAATNGGTATGLGGGATASFIGADDWTDLLYGRAAPYRGPGAYVGSNGAILKAAKYTDLNGQRIWQPAIAAGQPDTFDGKPVYEDPNLATPASATKSVLFGDWSRATIVKMSPLRVSQTDGYRFAEDQIALKVVLRVGIAVDDAAGAAYLVSAAT